MSYFRVSFEGIGEMKFDPEKRSSWNGVQEDVVDRILAMSKCEYQSDLDSKTKSFDQLVDSYRWDNNYLLKIYSVLKWFVDNNWAGNKSWLANVIRRLYTSVKNQMTKNVAANNSNSTSTKKSKTASVTKTEVKAPVAKKTAEVVADFPTFEDASFPDTSKDLFEAMLKSDSKMPKV